MAGEAIKLITLSQASKLAKIISNKTGKEIINYINISKKATASQLARTLKIPASTIHYNIKGLVKAEIIDDSQFTYSSKGKIIIHYTLTNNILVIIPESKDKFSLFDSLKAIMPSILGVGILGIGYTLFVKHKLRSLLLRQSLIQEVSQDFTLEPMNIIAKSSPEVIVQTVSKNTEHIVPSLQNFWWGLALATIVFVAIFLIQKYFVSRKNK